MRRNKRRRRHLGTNDLSEYRVANRKVRNEINIAKKQVDHQSSTRYRRKSKKEQHQVGIRNSKEDVWLIYG